jgi:hypothetical protein
MLAEIIGYALMLSLIDVIEQVMSNSAIEKLDPLGRPQTRTTACSPSGSPTWAAASSAA